MSKRVVRAVSRPGDGQEASSRADAVTGIVSSMDLAMLGWNDLKKNNKTGPSNFLSWDRVLHSLGLVGILTLLGE